MLIYLDNAATTPLDPKVLEAMQPYLSNNFGNPSSVHSHGRAARTAIETSRKTIAEILNVSPPEIIFTSGGTEADNTFLTGAIEAAEVEHFITTRIEHPAILQTISFLEKRRGLRTAFVNLDSRGNVDLDHLQRLLVEHPNSLVTLMHANNEIGNLTDLAVVANLVKSSGSIYHTDAVQSMGHLGLDLATVQVHGLAASAHKFHGPKGNGFMFIRRGTKLSPFIKGGSQERGYRGGTENVYGIVGTAKALELAVSNLQEDERHIAMLKLRMIEKLTTAIKGLTFNGNSADPDLSLYTILSVSMPPSERNEMLLFNLDLNQISASGGSACASGASVGSHVLEALNADPDRQTIRFSFSRFNTVEEIDIAADKLIEVYESK
jgi:cysteine desulfurase